jgi:hypothetical protein
MQKKNSFLSQVSKGNTTTWNGALSNSSTGSLLVDQFGKAGAAVNREFSDVFADQSALWGQDPSDAMKFALYLRLITRQTKMFDGEKTETVQRGQGNVDESLKRLLWVALYHPTEFYKNLWLLPLVGSWKDLFIMLSMSSDLDSDKFFELIQKGMNDPYHKDLIKKYMPRIRSNAKCVSTWAIKTNAIAKALAHYLGWTYTQYREFKSNGKAHKFQRDICGGLYDNLDFNQIPGKALSIFTKNDTFLKKHGLYDKYMKWIESQPIAKFTGYAYELGLKLPNRTNIRSLSPVTKITVDKQFDGLIELAKKDNGGIKGNVWCALDTSGSMTWSYAKKDLSCYTVAKSLAIYFATLNEGAFHKNVIMFDSESEVAELSGSFSDMWNQIPEDAMGSTNFQSVVDEIIRVRRNNPNVPLEDYPQTLLIVSDMQFNPTNNGWGNVTSRQVTTNYEEMKYKLAQAFPKEFVDDMKFIWWQVNASTTDFPSTMDDPGTYVISGFDGSIVSILLGGEDTFDQNGNKIQLSMEEMVDKALNQELLMQVKI